MSSDGSPAINASIKSILKKTVPVGFEPVDAQQRGLPAARTVEEKQRLESAIAHATRLEDEKTASRNVFHAIDELSEFPDSHADDHVSTAERFLRLVDPFHPSDYDSLIEERNAAGKCGYTLCRNPPKRSKAQSALVQSLLKSPWCCALCGKRALYIKAQLDETPAWERRAAGRQVDLQLRPDDVSNTGPTVVALPIRPAPVDSTRQQTLAIERGESAPASGKIVLVSTDIIEKPSTGQAKAPSMHQDHDAIEGYRAARTTYNIDDDTLTTEKQRQSRTEDYLDLINQPRIKVNLSG